MTDSAAGSTGAAASSAPGNATPSIEEISAQIRKDLEASFDERVKGFQRVISSKDERLTAFENELKQLKTASLSPEELEELQEREKDQRIAELESRLELNELAGEFGAEMPYFQELLAADNAQDQLKVFRKFRDALAPKSDAAAEAQPDADLEVPDVDPNAAPSRNPRFAGEMSDEVADQILGGFGRQVLANFTQRRR